MRASPVCPEDLLVLGRRRALTAVEERALAEHLPTCSLCRMSLSLGREVGPLPALHGGDVEMAARMVARALAPRAVPRPVEIPYPRNGTGELRVGGRPGLAPRSTSQRPEGEHRAVPPAGAGPGTRKRRWLRGRRPGPVPRWLVAAAALMLMAGAASAAWWRISSWEVRPAPSAVDGERAPRAPAVRRRSRAPASAPPTEVAPAPPALPPAEVAPAPPALPPAEVAPAPPALPPAKAAPAPPAPPPAKVAPAPTAPPPAKVAPAPTAPPPAEVPSPPRPAAAAEVSRPPPPTAVRLAVAAPASSRPVARPPLADRDPGPSAAALFLEANRARRMRRFAEATRLYRALQASFPASEEARLAWLSLADLYLSRGRALEALTEFDGYLASGDAVLEEEALVGRARALARLGARAKERATWKELLAKHPRSAYAWRARQRLQELDASDP